MEFSIGTQFSREFSFEESSITKKLSEGLNKWFINKNYNSEIQKIYIDFICVSKGFEPFFIVRPLKILKKEPAIEYEIKLDFDNFFNSNVAERTKILNNEFLNQSKIILNNKKIKNFDLKGFVNDLEKYFSTLIYL